jgi:hypothetical protein
MEGSVMVNENTIRVQVWGGGIKPIATFSEVYEAKTKAAWEKDGLYMKDHLTKAERRDLNELRQTRQDQSEQIATVQKVIDALSRTGDWRGMNQMQQLAALKAELPDVQFIGIDRKPLENQKQRPEHQPQHNERALASNDKRVYGDEPPERQVSRQVFADTQPGSQQPRGLRAGGAMHNEAAQVIQALTRALDTDPSLDAAHKARILEHMANGVSRATASQQQVPAVPAETPPKVQQEKTQAALPENIRQAIVAEGGRITASVGGGIDSGNVNYGVNVAHHIAGPLQGGVGLSVNQEGSVSANVNAQAVIPAGPVVVYPMASVGVNDIGGNSSLSASAGGLIVKTGEIGGHAVGGYVGGLVNEKGDGTVLANASIAATDKLTFSAGVSYDVAKDNLRESIEALYRVKDNLTVRIGVDTDELQDTSVGAQISYDYGR